MPAPAGPSNSSLQISFQLLVESIICGGAEFVSAQRAAKARNKMAANKDNPPKLDCDLVCLLINNFNSKCVSAVAKLNSPTRAGYSPPYRWRCQFQSPRLAASRYC